MRGKRLDTRHRDMLISLFRSLSACEFFTSAPLCVIRHRALIQTIFFPPTPFFRLTVILSSHPSFYSCCQISPSTPGKLHFSDYTPIKGPVGTLFACCILSLETEILRVCVCVHAQSFLKYYRLRGEKKGI